MKYEYFERLPESMSQSEIEILFEKVIEEYLMKNYSRDEFVDIIFRLTMVHTMNQKLLSINNRNKLDEIIMVLWDPKNSVEREIIVYIIINLGLQNSYDNIKNTLDYWKNEDYEIYYYLNDIYNRYGDNISVKLSNYVK